MPTIRSLRRFARSNPGAPGGQHRRRLRDRGDGWSVIGFTSDNHLGSKFERMDVLEELYTIFAGEGVTDVYQAGNWIDGESRMTRHDTRIFGLQNQVDYFVEKWPVRKGITTHFVAGDDHEGWYQKRELIHIGPFAEMAARKAGREDLVYLGYLEADVALSSGGAATPMRIMHGGGGATYAYSYVLQKTVESFQGGEKPGILCLGHHHKWDYCYPRNVHAFMPGCTEDQSSFMRKKKIEAHVGGVLGWIKQDPKDGHILRFRAEWIPFYDKGYYERRFE